MVKRGIKVYLLLGVSYGIVSAQQVRIPAGLEESQRMTLAGHRPGWARPEADLGPVADSEVIHYATLVFRRTPAQEAELARLRSGQRDSHSTDYHRWLTPAQFADRFGMSAADLARVGAWLVSKGFTIDAQAVSRTWIAFSGTAAQVNAAFGADLHRYRVRGAVHRAPSGDLSIPAALGAAVLGIRGLDDLFGEHVGHKIAEGTPALEVSNGRNALAPGDLEAIYGIVPLRAEGLDGSGQSIAIVGRSNVDLNDLKAYRMEFNLPPKTPSIVAVTDPGVSFLATDQEEASLDMEISSAIAPQADQTYVYANNIEDALQYVIDKAIAPVMSSSYLNCESGFAPSHMAMLAAMAQEADTKGISWVNASGDSGAASCDAHDVTNGIATNGLWVNVYAAIPEVTGVGGTAVVQGTAGETAWNSIDGTNVASATGYVPETAWNDSLARGSLEASGGGVSRGFAKPSWQQGPGVPNDGMRDVPDISLLASSLRDAYSICNASSCNGLTGGTSAGTPLFAGVVALLNQYLIKHGALKVAGLGSINANLYSLATASTNLAAVFHDITTGDNIVPCAAGSPDCAGGTLGYSAGTGYDLATGWGSVDVGQLFAVWLAKDLSLAPSTTLLTLATPGSPDMQTFQVTVSAANGGSAPTGSVTLAAGAVLLGTVPLSRGSNSSSATFSIYSNQLPAGISLAVARYGGDTAYAPSSSAPVAVTITPASGGKPSVQLSSNPGAPYQSPSAYGNAWNFTLTLREVNGFRADLTSLTRFLVNGTEGPTDLTTYFGAKLPAFGTVSVPFQLSTPPVTGAQAPSSTLSAFAAGTTPSAQLKGLASVTAPGSLNLELDFPAATAGGNPQVTSLSLPLLTRPGAADMRLSGAPASVLKNLAAASNCQWNQQLLLREYAGTGVTLSKFLAGGQDQTASIASLFGSTRLPAGGALVANMCWSGLSVPTLVNYEVDGNDDHGNSITAGFSAAFLNPPTSSNTLAAVAANTTLKAPLNLNTANGSLMINVSVSGKGQIWRVSSLAAGPSPAWLTVYPASGAGSGSVFVAVASGLASGTYNATLVVESIDATPQTVTMPVTYTVR
jgi:hypothetical protein